MIHVDRYEKLWIGVSLGTLVLFLIAIVMSSFGSGIQVSGVAGQVDPRTVATPGVSPFGEPGVREVAPGQYEAYVVARAWNFTPRQFDFKVGDRVTFYFTSVDVQHGVKIENTNINMMILPGQVSKLSHTFTQEGKFFVACHEYCGAGHHTMAATINVSK